MNKEELLKEIMKLPKAEIINLISAMNVINVDDLISAIDRLNKIPDYNDLLKENKQLKDNWNKLKEYANKMHKYFLYTNVNEIYTKSMKEDNSFPNLFNLSELNASDKVLNSICKKIQELEQGSDSK